MSNSSVEETGSQAELLEALQEKFRYIPKAEFESLLELRRVLTAENFRILIYNTIIGNQVIVRGDSISMVTSALSVLQTLLPPACCRVVPYDITYQEAWKCNFLGLAGSTELPTDVDLNSCTMLDIRYDRFDDFVNNSSFSNQDFQSGKFQRFYFQVTYGSLWRRSSSRKVTTGSLTGVIESPQNMNSYVAQLEQILSQEPSKSLFDTHMLLIREEWINKTKLFFKFSRSIQTQTEEKLKKFTKIMGLKDSDIPLLKFWTAGLGREHRAKLLAS